MQAWSNTPARVTPPNDNEFQQSRKSRKSKKMQRRRVMPKGMVANQQDEGTARKIGKKASDERIDEDRKEKKKMGVFRKLGMMLNPDKEQGSVMKRKAAPKKKATERKRRSGSWNPDKKVHFNIDKPHSSIPLKGDPISDLQKKVFTKFAAEAVKKSPPEYSTEFMSQIKPYFGAPMERKIFDSNPTKNRYKDVVCNDLTRVILNDGYEGDYIHANYVNGLNVPFILTQGPTQATIVDFWRMMVHTKTSYIVMLCDLVEDGRPKCGAYFPDHPGATVTFGIWSVTCVSEDDKDQNIHKRTLSVRIGKEEQHVVKHLHTKSWPDKSVPNSTLSLLRMLYIVRTATGPVTVHCSAGIGRTGTFVAVEACLQVLTDGKELDVLTVVKQLRNSRAGSVQVDIQYMSLVQILINYGKDNGYWDDADLDDRVELLTWNIQQFIQSRGRNDVLLVTPSTPNLSCVPAHVFPPTAPAPPVAQAPPPPAAALTTPPPQNNSRKSQKMKHTVGSQKVTRPAQKKAPLPPSGGVVSKDSTEEEDEQTKAPQPPAPAPPAPAPAPAPAPQNEQKEEAMQTMLPLAPTVVAPETMAPAAPLASSPKKTTPPPPQPQQQQQNMGQGVKKSAEKVVPKESKFDEMRKDRSQYFM